jgi:hypothetical protein
MNKRLKTQGKIAVRQLFENQSALAQAATLAQPTPPIGAASIPAMPAARDPRGGGARRPHMPLCPTPFMVSGPRRAAA